MMVGTGENPDERSPPLRRPAYGVGGDATNAIGTVLGAELEACFCEGKGVRRVAGFTSLASAREPTTAFLIVFSALTITCAYSSIGGAVRARRSPPASALGVTRPDVVLGKTAECVAFWSRKMLLWKQSFYWYATGDPQSVVPSD